MKINVQTLVSLCLLILVVSGCSSTARFPDNPALANVNSIPDALKSTRSSNEILLAMTFSGGGSRASAFAYGVLEELSQTPVTPESVERMTEEIDQISSVSGGSITAAYFGLYGNKLFRHFKEEFLDQDIESELASKTLSIGTLSKLSSPTYGTGDMLDEYFGEKLFADASIDKLMDDQGPQVQINATDLFKGGGFGFTKEQFELICSDPSQFPVSRAVAASCAVPIIFAPITLNNRAGSCGHVPPAWFYSALLEDNSNKRRYQRARLLSTYLDQKNHPYIHLLDGGLTDNLGLRALIDKLVEEDGMWNTLKRYNQQDVRHIAIIVVNAASVTPSQWEQRDTNPPESVIIDAATTIPLINHNFETLEYFRQHLPRWQKEIVEGQCKEQHDCLEKPVYLIELSLQDIADDELRAELTQVPTGFSLPEGSSDKLIDAGRTLLRQHPEFIRLLKNLAAQR